MKFYSLDNILKKHATYNMIIGERSNGKTFACLKHALKKYKKDGSKLAIIRRWDEDFKGRRGSTMFDALKSEGVLKELFPDYDTISFSRNMWYLAKYENGKVIKDLEPFAYAFALSTMEHDKSTSYPSVKTVFFDEFITREHYLPDEFKLFQNTLSTIIRQRSDVEIFMAANTVDRYNIYFEEMGLTHAHDQAQGTIDVYKYGDDDNAMTVAVEYCSSTKGKASDKYFAFDNPNLSMITSGTWEIDIYPHLPIKYKPANVVYKFYLLFNHAIIQGNFINIDEEVFIYFHRKTTPLKELDEDIIYSPDYSYKTNHKRNLLKATDSFSKLVNLYFRNDKVFYQTNEVGEIVRRYIMWCEEQ